jgi:hypothetical protein
VSIANVSNVNERPEKRIATEIKKITDKILFFIFANVYLGL